MVFSTPLIGLGPRLFLLWLTVAVLVMAYMDRGTLKRVLLAIVLAGAFASLALKADEGDEVCGAQGCETSVYVYDPCSEQHLASHGEWRDWWYYIHGCFL